MTQVTQRVSVESCPICGRPAVPAYAPFCSGRCADVDLNRWLSEVYRVPAAEPGDDEDAEPPQPFTDRVNDSDV